MRPGLSVQLRHQLLIVLAASAVFFIGLGSARLWDEDETEYSRVAREMMIRGDWVVPTFNYRPWLEKPVFVYWLMIGSFRLFGVTEFAARFPSALFAVGTALLAYHLGRRLFRPQVGLWAGLILATTLNFVVIGRAATHDAGLIFFTTASLLAYVLAMGRTFWRRGTAWPSPFGPSDTSPTRERGADTADPRLHLGLVSMSDTNCNRVARFRAVLPQFWWQFVLMYLPLGVAVMIKGPFGVLLPIASLGMFVWISGSWMSPVGGEPAGISPWRRVAAMLADFPAATWAMRPFTLAAIVLGVAAPWFVLAELRTHGEVSRVFFWEHNVQYILHAHQGHAGSSLYFYPLALLVGFFPWTIVLALGVGSMVRRIRHGDGRTAACMLAITWSVTWIVAMSLVGTKLPHYIVPTYPLLSVVAGLAIVEWIGTGRLHCLTSVVPRQAPNPLAAPSLVVARLGIWGRFGKRVARLNWISAGLLLLIGIGIAIVVGMPVAFHRWLPGQPSYNWLGLILAIGGLASWLLQRYSHRAAAAISLAATAGAFYLAISAVAAGHFSREQSSVQMAEAIERFAPESAPVAIYRAHLPGTLFYLDRRNPVVALMSEGGRSGDDSPAHDDVHVTANGEPVDLRQLFVDHPDSLLITDPQGLAEFRPQLPDDAIVLDDRPRFPKRGELVIVGRRLATATTRSDESRPLEASPTKLSDQLRR